MIFSLRWLRQRLFTIAPAEATFARRRFHAGDAAMRQRLEQIGQTFLAGYHTALEVEEPVSLARLLNQVEAERRGFAFEGAAMALALLDQFSLRHRQRWRAFVQGPGQAHIYMVHVGYGWTIARLPWLRRRIDASLASLDPLLRWLAVEGYGFHEGYFSWPRRVAAHRVPPRLRGYVRRAFDQGLGRSLWFVDGADEARIAATIAHFPPARQADLWSGVGLACAYAGGVRQAAIATLRDSAGPYQPQLAQGAAFAAKARQRAGNPAAHTELACELLCGMSAATAAHLTDACLEHLPGDATEPAFEVWRQRIQAHFQPVEVTTP